MNMEIDDMEVRGNRQQKLSNVRKEKSRDAARNRRSKENLQYIELAKLLPLPEAVTSQLDKASVIRLTISFLKYRELTGKEVRKKKNQLVIKPVKIGNKEVSPYTFEKDLGLHYLQALDGFLFCVSQEGRFLYISETVSTHLGLPQLDLVGSSVFNVLHPDDHKEFSELLCRPVQPTDKDFMNFDDFDAMTFTEMNRKANQGYISMFIRMKCALVKRGGCYVKSSGYKVIHVSGQLVPFKKVDQNGERSYALVATGQPLPPPTICQLKLDTKCFVSRVGMDLRISFCEGKIRKYMNFTARDIVGMSAYEFYHLNDMMIVQDAHTDCINVGKCVSRAYRWMNKTGGWVWMQTVGTVIKRNTPHGEESQILCVNYISSDIEESDEVMHSIQQHFTALEIKDKPSISQKDNLEDFGVDATQFPTPSSNEITTSYSPAEAGSTVYDKDSYLLSLEYDNQVNLNNQMMSNSNDAHMLDDLFTPQGISIPPVHDRIPSWQESQAMDDANDLATHLLMAEMEADKTPMKFPFEDGPVSPQSSYADFSPVTNSFPPPSNEPTSRGVFSMKSTTVIPPCGMENINRMKGTYMEDLNQVIPPSLNSVSHSSGLNPNTPGNGNLYNTPMFHNTHTPSTHLNPNFPGIKTEPMIEDPFVAVTMNCFSVSQPAASTHELPNVTVSDHNYKYGHYTAPNLFNQPNLFQKNQYSVGGHRINPPPQHAQQQRHITENTPSAVTPNLSFPHSNPMQNVCFNTTSYGDRLLKHQQHMFTSSTLPYF